MDLADVQSSTSVVCERKEGILQRMSIRMLSSLLANFVSPHRGGKPAAA